MFKETYENITGSFQTDYIKKNAEFRGKAGLTCYIERKDGHNCCKWCAGLAGRYRYPDEVPKDVYRRHDNCTCDVSYVSEKGRQNVHTRQWANEQAKAQRIEYEKPTKRTREEAQAKESEILARKELTYDEKRGIINANHKMAATGQQPPDFSLYEVREDFEAVQAVKKMMVEELGILENNIDLSGIKNADVLKPFMNRWKRIQKETGMKLPAIRAMDVIYGDECCVANFRPTENVFYISSKFFNSKKALLDTIKKWANNNIMPTQCKSIAYIAEHEAAHIRYSDKFNNNADVISMHKGFMKSKFANSNDRNLSEFVADSIAWSKVSPANIPPKMQELVDYIKAEVKT